MHGKGLAVQHQKAQAAAGEVGEVHANSEQAILGGPDRAARDGRVSAEPEAGQAADGQGSRAAGPPELSHGDRGQVH